jgi:hypothetical protein
VLSSGNVLSQVVPFLRDLPLHLDCRLQSHPVKVNLLDSCESFTAGAVMIRFARNLPIILLIVLVMALSAVNLALLRKNQALTDSVNTKYEALEASPGSLVPALRGRTLDGTDVSFNWNADRDTILLVFSTTCPFCDDNWPKWLSLLRRIDRNRVKPILVDLSGSADTKYLPLRLTQGLPLISKVDPSVIVPYKLRLVPQTILIGGDAHVIKVWTGVLEPKEEEDILRRYEQQPIAQVTTK